MTKCGSVDPLHRLMLAVTVPDAAHYGASDAREMESQLGVSDPKERAGGSTGLVRF